MAVKQYSYKKDGKKVIGDFFKIGDFRCRDKSDIILIDDVTVGWARSLRLFFGLPMIVVSAFRTLMYNLSIGSSKTSQHVRGTAMDIKIPGVPPRRIAEQAEKMGVHGIGLYEYSGKYGLDGFVHIDNRPGKGRWWKDNPHGKELDVPGHSFLYVPPAPKPKPEVPPMDYSFKTVTAKSGLRLRTDKNASSTKNIITVVPNGAKVKVLATEDGWVKVQYADKVGYMSGQYLK